MGQILDQNIPICRVVKVWTKRPKLGQYYLNQKLLSYGLHFHSTMSILGSSVSTTTTTISASAVVAATSRLRLTLIEFSWMIRSPIVVASTFTIPVSGTSPAGIWGRGTRRWRPICGSDNARKVDKNKFNKTFENNTHIIILQKKTKSAAE